MPVSKPVIKVGAVCGAIAAIVGVGGMARSVLQSDPPPLAGKSRVDDLNVKLAATLDQVQKAITALQKHQDRSDAQQRQMRLDVNSQKRKATIRDMLQVESDLVHRPNDMVLKAALAQDQQDLADLAQEHSEILSEKAAN